MTSSEIHSASTTLDDIINELKLTYDSSIGILDGDGIREIPSLNVLHNLSKLVDNLAKDLDDVENVDTKILEAINAKLNPTSNEGAAHGDEDQSDDIYNGHSLDNDFAIEDKHKRQAEDMDDNDADESIPLAKRRKPNHVASKIKIEEEEEQQDIKEDSKANSDNINQLNNQEDKEIKYEGDKLEKDKEATSTTTEEIIKEEITQNGNVDVTGEVNSKDDPVPPIQQGSFTQDNDTRLKNPKSEFVTSQTLPATAIADLGLYSEDNNGLETHGKEFFKKKFGVASYPERDLQDMLPGEIPNIDFSKNKPPSNQVQFTTFQTYIESFFRPFSNEDISFLNEKNIIPPAFEKTDYDPNLTPYLIPKLGQFYADVWAEEDATLAAKLNSPAYHQSSLDSYKPKGSINTLSDDKLYTEEISCGPLSSRLLSAILSVNEGDEEDEEKKNSNNNQDDNSMKRDSVSEYNTDGLSVIKSVSDEDVATKLDSGEDYKVNTEVNDFYSIEERLKRELKYIGIFMNLPTKASDEFASGANDKSKLKLNGKATEKISSVDESTGVNSSIIDTDDWIKYKEDDEICAEIRLLQKELKEATSRNKQRKKKLVPIVEEQIAYQEYCTILEDLDKQVDQAYMKRLKAKSKKKKHHDATPQQQAVNNGLRVLLDKRKRWIENIGKLFKPAEITKRVPKESIFKEDDQSDEEEVDGDDDIVNDTEALIQK